MLCHPICNWLYSKFAVHIFAFSVVQWATMCYNALQCVVLCAKNVATTFQWFCKEDILRISALLNLLCNVTIHPTFQKFRQDSYTRHFLFWNIFFSHTCPLLKHFSRVHSRTHTRTRMCAQTKEHPPQDHSVLAVQHSAENTRKHTLQHTLQHNATQKCTIKIGNRGVLAVQQTAAYCYVVQHTVTHTATRTETHCSKKMHHQRAITASLQCSTLQQIAADCNVLQHTATHTTHCNTLQHTATQQRTLEFGNHSVLAVQHTAVTAAHCNILEHTETHTATHCNTLQHTATHCNTLQHKNVPSRSAITASLLSLVRWGRHSEKSGCRLFGIATLVGEWRFQNRYLPVDAVAPHTHCLAMQRTATHCNTLQRTATHCNALQRTAIHCNTLLHTATLCRCYLPVDI